MGVQLTPTARGFVTRVAGGGERAAEPEGAESPSPKAGAGTSGGAAVSAQGPGLRNVRVNDPARDRHQQDQTTQSETTIAVHVLRHPGRHPQLQPGRLGGPLHRRRPQLDGRLRG